MLMTDAMTRGITRKRTGFKAWASSASISSPTTIVPISAAMAAPANPVSTIAAISGPSSRKTATPVIFATSSLLPKSSRGGAICSTRMRPTHPETREMMNSDRTPDPHDLRHDRRPPEPHLSLHRPAEDPMDDLDDQEPGRPNLIEDLKEPFAQRSDNPD